MKLDKRQITALASKFQYEINTNIDKYNKENKSKQLEKFRSDYDKGVKLLENNKYLSEIDIIIGKGYSVSLNRGKSFEKYTSSYSFNNVINKKDEVRLSDIEQDIVLSTINSQSIEDIIKVLESKYK